VGTSERGNVGEQGAGLKRGGDVRRWQGITWSWARPRWGERGREVEDELTGGVGRAEREAGARARGTASTDLAHGAARERGREGTLVGTDRRGPPVRHRGRARGVGLSGSSWAELGFLFSKEFLIVFPFIFSRVFKSCFKFSSNQTCATIQRIFGLNMMQYFMTHMVLPK
jgi:hypothetical protein